jgi:hypothetical protein
LPITPLDTLPKAFLADLRETLDQKFELQGVIGHGKNGVALLVSMPNNSVNYCLKTVLPQATSAAEIKDAKEKLFKEVKILEPLTHNCLPKIIFSDFFRKIAILRMHISSRPYILRV